MQVSGATTSLWWWMEREVQVKVVVVAVLALLFLTTFIVSQLSDHPIFCKKWSWISLSIAIPNILFLLYQICLADKLSMQEEHTQNEGNFFPKLIPASGPRGIILDYLDPRQRCQMVLHYLPHDLTVDGVPRYKKVAEYFGCRPHLIDCLKKMDELEQRIQGPRKINKFWNDINALKIENKKTREVVLDFLLMDYDHQHFQLYRGSYELYLLWSYRKQFTENQLAPYMDYFTIATHHFGRLNDRGNFLMVEAMYGNESDVNELLLMGIEVNDVSEIRRRDCWHTRDSSDPYKLTRVSQIEGRWQRIEGGNSALHFAVLPFLNPQGRKIDRELQKRKIRLLIQAGANPDLPNASGQTPRYILPQVYHSLLELQNRV